MDPHPAASARPARAKNHPPVAPAPLADRRSAPRDRAIVGAVSRWFLANARPFPWRTSPRDPYASLVSEFMLQQTQVSRVLEKFAPFIARFPTIQALANADEAAVLAEWSGLGYYRRARLLHAAARAVVDRFDGRIPHDAALLRDLPGIGRYTAGAIASLVFDHPEPLVDGNVARILLRVEGRQLEYGEQAPEAWRIAERLMRSTGGPARAAALNEGLMELGATICTPRSPRCDACPLSRHCRSHRLGLTAAIPNPKPRSRQLVLFADCLLARDGTARTLVEQRPNAGMWAGMWQAPTFESSRRPSRDAAEAAWKHAPLRRLFRFDHQTTHRLVRFTVWDAGTVAASVARRLSAAGRAWRSPHEIARLPISNPQKRILLASG